MNVKWSSHIKDSKDKKDFEAYVKNSSSILERLTDLIEKKIEDAEVPKADYESSAWAYKQADRIGQIRAYKEILSLTKLK